MNRYEVAVPILEFKFPEPSSTMFELTCKNHPTAKYLTKHPLLRGLHFIKAAYGFAPNKECPCSFTELAVIGDSSDE
jgi:hypothetical protein